MPILYEDTRYSRRYSQPKPQKVRKFSPGPDLVPLFVAFGVGAVFGPFLWSLFGYTMKRAEVRAKRIIRARV